MTLSNLPTNHNYCQDAPLAKDVPSGTLTSQESHSSALQYSKYSFATPLSDIQNSLELERTPGAVAVSGVNGRDRAGEKIKALPALKDPSRPSGTPPTNSPLSTSLSPQAEKTFSPYLDVGDNVNDKVQAWLALKGNTYNVEDWLNIDCSTTQFFIPGHCENGHRVAKVISCGKEWCSRCGEKKSVAHNTRFVRWLPKIQQFSRMRYLVFTIPEDIRANYRTKESLTVLGRAVQDLLKRQGFTRGLRRWHWFGDKSHKWHPHLNILVEGGYLNGATLAAIKKSYADLLGVEKVSVRTSYKPRPSDMAGCLYYVTRATFHDWSWDVEMALELHNFRNMVVWGRDWDNEPVWQLSKKQIKDIAGEKINIEAIEKLTHKDPVTNKSDPICPVCGAPVTWGDVLPQQLLGCVDKDSLGAGYYLIVDRPPPSLESSFDTRVKYLTGQHGIEGNIFQAYVRKAREHQNEIEELRYSRELDKKLSKSYSKYWDDIAWIEVLNEMAAEKQGHNG